MKIDFTCALLDGLRPYLAEIELFEHDGLSELLCEDVPFAVVKYKKLSDSGKPTGKRCTAGKKE